MGSGGACPHHGRKGKAPSGAEGVPPSTAVDRRRRGLHRGHRPRAARAPRTREQPEERKRWGIEKMLWGPPSPAMAGSSPLPELGLLRELVAAATGTGGLESGRASREKWGKATAAARVAVAGEARPAPDRPAGCSALLPATSERGRGRESGGLGFFRV
jgi:hypothetical protein